MQVYTSSMHAGIAAHIHYIAVVLLYLGKMRLKSLYTSTGVSLLKVTGNCVCVCVPNYPTIRTFSYQISHLEFTTVI